MPAGAMMDLSYAQNLEDLHLWRAFDGMRCGTYVDVGAGHPIADNVSCWFYLHGWRGLVVEPQHDLAARYAAVRPRDAVFCGVAGRATGAAAFHVVDRLHGMSSLSEGAAGEAARFGAGYTTRHVPMETLTNLCERHRLTEIDFMKIDVEGAEEDALAGLDLARIRPRVFCIEAMAPGTMAENWSGWEPRLLEADYVFTLFDGLNRFYVAREAGDVLARFPREKAQWGSVPTLGLNTHAPDNAGHPDHSLARALTRGLLSRLPILDRALLAQAMADLFTPQERAAPATRQAKEAALDRIAPPASLYPHARAGLLDIEVADIGAFLASVLDSDAMRVALGRIAMSYDGGQFVD